MRLPKQAQEGEGQRRRWLSMLSISKIKLKIAPNVRFIKPLLNLLKGQNMTTLLCNHSMPPPTYIIGIEVEQMLGSEGGADPG